MAEPRTKSLWELLWDYDPNGLVVVDAALRIRVVNPAFCRLFGVEAEAVLGQEARLVLDAEDLADFRAIWAEGSSGSAGGRGGAPALPTESSPDVTLPEDADRESGADSEAISADRPAPPPAPFPGKERYYPERGLYVRKVVFAIHAEQVSAAIFVDLTRQHQQREEILKLRRETIAKANEVVDNQMKVAQEIAGLLGETTAETKISLLRLIETLGDETVD